MFLAGPYKSCQCFSFSLAVCYTWFSVLNIYGLIKDTYSIISIDSTAIIAPMWISCAFFEASKVTFSYAGRKGQGCWCQQHCALPKSSRCFKGPLFTSINFYVPSDFWLYNLFPVTSDLYRRWSLQW